MIALLKNNKSLALALENNRAEKEELLAECKANADLIMILKKAASVVEETLSLLEMESSTCITKHIPKSNICREKFKEQLKEVSMAVVAEEIESPQSKQSKESVVNKTEGLSAISENSEAESFPVNRHSCHNSSKNMSDKRCLLKNVTNASSKQGWNEFPLKEISVDTGFSKKISENCLSSSTQLKRNKASSRKSAQKAPLIRNISETKSLLLKSWPLNKRPLETSVTLCRKSKEIKTPYSPENILKGINVLKDSSVDMNFAKSISCKNNQMCESWRNQKSLNLAEITNNSIELTEVCFDSFKPVHGISDVSNDVKHSLGGDCNANVVSDSNEKLLSFDHAKENVEVCEFQDKFISTQFELFKEPELKFSSPQKLKVKKTPLKNLLSEMNIENFKQGLLKQPSLSQLNDLTVMAVMEKNCCPIDTKKSKSNHIMIQTNSIITKKTYSENMQTISDNDNHFTKPHSGKSIHQEEEMVRNLAKNTFLVTAEIHELPKSTVSKKVVSHQSTDCAHCIQPVVLVNDIFKANKSFCRSISRSSINGPNEIPLEKQLLEHCSSLKLIPHQSSEAQNKNSTNVDINLKSSVEQDRNFGHTKAVTFFEELPLFVEGGFKEELLNEEKKKLRKRSSICYTEPSLVIKMRR